MTSEALKPLLARGAAWLTGSRLVFNALGFLSTLVLARLLTPADFGLVAIAMAVNAVLASLFTMSAASALVRIDRLTNDHLNTAWTFGVARGILISFGLAIASWPIATIYNDDRLFYVLLVIALATLIESLLNPSLVILQKRLLFWPDFLMSATQKAVSVAVAVAVAYTTGSYWALILGVLASKVTLLIVSYVIRPYRPRLSLTEWREIWGFTGWMSASDVVQTLNFKLDQFFLGSFLGQATLGRYVVGDDLASLPVREATRPLSQLLYPAFSRMGGNLSEIRRTYLKSQQLIFAVAMPLGVGFSLVAVPAVQLFLGKQWAESAVVIQGLATIFALQTFSGPGPAVAMTLGATKSMFLRDTVNLILRVPVVLSGLFLGGLQGLVIARVCSGTVIIVLTVAMVKKLTGLSVRRQIKSVRRTLISSVVMSLVILGWVSFHGWTVENAGSLWVEMISVIAIGALVYASTHMLLWVVEGRPEEVESEFQALLRSFFLRVGARSWLRLG